MKTVIYFDMDGTCNHWDLQGNPYEEHYFLHREPFPNVLSAVRQLKEMGVAVAFATAVFMEGTARQDKILWLKNNRMEDIPVIFIPYGECKDKYLPGDNRILIDDHTPNLLEFAGTGIKLINKNNHTGGKWTGNCLRYDDEPQNIVDFIMNLAESRKGDLKL